MPFGGVPENGTNPINMQLQTFNIYMCSYKIKLILQLSKFSRKGKNISGKFIKQHIYNFIN